MTTANISPTSPTSPTSLTSLTSLTSPTPSNSQQSESNWANLESHKIQPDKIRWGNISLSVLILLVSKNYIKNNEDVVRNMVMAMKEKTDRVSVLNQISTKIRSLLSGKKSDPSVAIEIYNIPFEPKSSFLPDPPPLHKINDDNTNLKSNIAGKWSLVQIASYMGVNIECEDIKDADKNHSETKRSLDNENNPGVTYLEIKIEEIRNKIEKENSGSQMDMLSIRKNSDDLNEATQMFVKLLQTEHDNMMRTVGQ